MSSEHTISIAAASPDGSRRARDADVSIPVGEVMASNGLVTGQSGADTAGSVRHIADELLAAGETLLVVDPTGEFGALADDAAAVHVGGDRNCDVEVQPSAADRVASLALEGNTSVVLDLQAFDASGADDLLGGLTDALIEAPRERPTELLVLVGECHRWLATDGPATRTGENLVQLGGRRHDGVGVVGVTDQPADLRDAVLGGVDWVLAHRLTWGEDVRAMERLLAREYTDALAELADDEAFFNAGWERDVTRLRFGVDPGCGTEGTQPADADIDDLLAGVEGATAPDDRSSVGNSAIGDRDDGNSAHDEEPLTEDAGTLREDIADIEERLASIEATLDAREDVETMADRIADAITEGLRGTDLDPTESQSENADVERAGENSSSRNDGPDGGSTTEAADSSADADGTGEDGPGGFGDVFGMFDDNDTVETTGTSGSDASSEDGAVASGSSTGESGVTDPTDPIDPTDPTDSIDPTPTTEGPASGGASGTDAGEDRAGDESSGGMSFKPIDFGFDEPGQAMDSTVPDDFGPPSRRAQSGRSIPRYLRKIVRSIEEMDETTLKMLGFYIDEGTESPMDAHFSAGGGGDRTRAYAHNRQLRTNGLIEHVGKGEYAPRLREYVIDRAGHSVPEHELDRAVRIIEQTVEAA